MANIFVYNDRLWRASQEFFVPGIYPFTVPAGEHLMMCWGAMSGAIWDSYHNLGGVSYGILNNSTPLSLKAYVGGNGGDRINGTTVAPGGFNGGGSGGKSSVSSWWSGSGGGGASDIRVKTPEDFIDPSDIYYPELPVEYQQIEYIQCDGHQYFDTGYIAKSNSTFVFSASYSSATNMAILGTQVDSAGNPGWIVWYGVRRNLPMLSSNYGTAYDADSTYSETNYGKYQTTINVNTNERATIQIDAYGTFVNDVPSYFNSSIAPSIGPDPNNTMLFLSARRGDDVTIGNRMFNGKAYYLRIYELDNDEYSLVHEFIPCIRLSDNTIGMYDTVTSEFNEPLKDSASSSNLVAGPEGSYYIEAQNSLKKRSEDIPTLPEGYSQIEYIKGQSTSCINTGYIASRDKDTVISVRAMVDGSGEYAIFGSQSDTNTNPGWLCWLNAYDGKPSICSIYGTMTWSSGAYRVYAGIQRSVPAMYLVRRTGINVNGKWMWEYNPSGEPDVRPIILMNSYRGSATVSAGGFIGKVYHFRIYEKEDDTYVMKHNFIPCVRTEDSHEGFIDLLADPESEFYFLDTGVTYPSSSGAIGEYPIVEPEPNEQINPVDPVALRDFKSLNTRIMVAGGAGGPTSFTETFYQTSSPYYIGCTGIGGGVNGGYREIFNDATKLYATQESGYSFGYGQNGRNGASQYNTNNNGYGCSGGGGGWYGGYSTSSTGSNTNCSGGGGSGYVLTDTSYKPQDYMENHQPYHFTVPHLAGGYSEYPCVRICEPVKEFQVGDIITVLPSFGKGQRIDLPSGKYRLRCWGGSGGGSGGPRYIANGGYAEGVLTLTAPNTLYAYVGGSGMYHNFISPEYTTQMRPDIGFNGGGRAYLYGTQGHCNDIGYPGGGGTDIRLGVDSLYARIIVAGGSGGNAYNGNNGVKVGGVGGGESGGTGTSGYGDSAGPGTQTAPGVSINYPTISGGFGYGGSVQYAYGGVGSGGGGGWYGGGSATRVQSGYYSYPISAGSGGSGYVLTENSYRPEGYLVSDAFELTDTTLIAGGNALHKSLTKIEIEVIETSVVLFLCRDKYGIKYYDKSLSRWANTPSQQLDQSLFEQYGSLMVDSDIGLDDDYEILIYDPDDTTTQASLNVVPHEQIIVNEMIDVSKNLQIREIKPRMEINSSVYDVDISVKKQIIQPSGTRLITTINVDKKSKSDENARIFYISLEDGR